MANQQDRINLQKQVGIVLDKRNLFELMVKVGAAFDVSGSTQGLFNSGAMQRALTRVFAIADKVDDNHTLDTWIFADDALEMPGIDPDNLDTYATAIISKSEDEDVTDVLWGGTKYAPFMKQIIDFYAEDTGLVAQTKGLWNKVKTFLNPPKQVVAPEPELPAFVMPFTDGDNFDETETEMLVMNTRNGNVFWQFVGVGDKQFTFLKYLTLNYEHVDFVDIRDLDKLSSDEMYEKLISEKFAKWIKTNWPNAIAQAGQQREQGK